jgi:hypothetical protein
VRIYVAGRFKEYQKVRSLLDQLVAHGHEITHDWTRNPKEFDAEGNITVEFSDIGAPALTIEEQIQAADDDQQGVATAEAVVLVGDSDTLYGALLETGMAFAYGIPVIVINPNRWSVFWTPSDLRRVAVVESPAEAIALLDEIPAEA